MRFSCSVALVFFLSACAQNLSPNSDPPVPTAEADQSEEVEIQTASFSEEEKIYLVKLETSKGDVLIEVNRDLSPLGADRFRELVESKFFDDTRFFRVIPGFVVQFGINGDPEVHEKWAEKNLKDEPVKTTNAKGTITFAKTQLPNTRSTQLFINLGNNANLDDMGFAPFAKVVKGMDIVDSIYSGYGERPDQFMIKKSGNDYLKKKYPNLDYIKKATIVKNEPK